MKSIFIMFLAVIIYFAIIISCTPKFDNPLDPTVNTEPSLFFEIHYPTLETIVDSTKEVYSDSLRTLYVIYGVENENDIDVTIEIKVNNGTTDLLEYNQIFNTEIDLLVDTLVFLPDKEAPYKISFNAYDPYNHIKKDTLYYYVDTSGIKGAYIAAYYYSEDTLHADLDITFNTICGVDFDSLKADSTSILIPKIQKNNKRNNQKTKRDDWLSYKNFNPEYDEEDNRIVLKKIPFESLKILTDLDIKFHLYDLFKREFDQVEQITEIFENEPVELIMEIVSDYTRFNEFYPTIFRLNKCISIDSMTVEATNGNGPYEINIQEISPYFYKIIDFSELEENEMYDFVYSYKGSILKEIELLYDKKEPEFVSIDPDTSYIFEDTLNCNIVFDEKIMFYNFYKNGSLLISETSVLSDSIEFDIPFENEGIYNFKIDFEDVVGNSSESSEYSWTYEYVQLFEITELYPDPITDFIFYGEEDSINVIMNFTNNVNAYESSITINQQNITFGVAGDTVFCNYHFTTGDSIFLFNSHFEDNYYQTIDTTWTYYYFPIPVLQVEPSLIGDIPASGGNYDVSVTSNVVWSVIENYDWISVDPMDGIFSENLEISCSENSVIDERTANVLISGEGITETITINQNGADPFLIVDPDTINVSHEFGNCTVDINSNISWEVIENAAWLIVEPDSGSCNDSLILTYMDNNTTEVRIAIIEVSDTQSFGLSVTITVIQEGLPYLSVTPDSIHATFTQGSYPADVTSNINWIVIKDAEWLDVNPISGSNNGPLNISVDENQGLSRVCVIIIQDNENLGLIDSIIVFQDSIPPPGVATSPFPENGATNVPVDTVLTWTNGSNTVTLDLYFDTIEPPVNQVLYNVPAATQTYTPSETLTTNTQYFWRVDCKNPSGIAEGEIWNFTTIGESK